MLLVLEPALEEKNIERVVRTLEELGIRSEVVRSASQIVIFVHTDVRAFPSHKFSQIDGVARVIRISSACPLASSDTDRAIDIDADGVKDGRVTMGGGAQPALIAGPCSVEGLEQILDLARRVKASGATMLRGGAFKPRTSPYEFAGLGAEALSYLKEARRLTGLPVVSEVMSCEQVEQALESVDLLQIGARNMYNYELLKEVGLVSKPVLLKRGISATIDEYLHAVEYIMLSGNSQVILCERGIRTFESRTRNTLDLSAVPLLKSLTGLPVVVDPSHATGKRNLVRPMSRAAIACGADGVMLEVHGCPDKSISDAEQAITPLELQKIAMDISQIFKSLSAIDQADLESSQDYSQPGESSLLVAASLTGKSLGK